MNLLGRSWWSESNGLSAAFAAGRVSLFVGRDDQRSRHVRMWATVIVKCSRLLNGHFPGLAGSDQSRIEAAVVRSYGVRVDIFVLPFDDSARRDRLLGRIVAHLLHHDGDWCGSAALRDA